MDTRFSIDPARVALRPTTLFDAALVALESGEFSQTRRTMYGRGRKRCAWGVLYDVARRAGIPDPRPSDIHPRMVEIDRLAGKGIGYAGIDRANDGGVTFGEIAGALRQARAAIEGRGDGEEAGFVGGQVGG